MGLYRKNALLGATAVLALGAFGPCAFAQDANKVNASASEAATNAAPNGVAEVVVTSRKRAENVKDVPISVTAVTAVTLEKYDIKDTVDLMVHTPSLQYSNFAVGNFNARLALRPLIFRGLTLTNDYGVTAASLIFLDGGPLLGGEAPVGADIERVEVLNGPQSAYFGRSTMAGAVNYITKPIGNEWHGQISGDFGEFNTNNVEGQISGPIIADKFKAGLAISRDSHGGYYKDNLAPGYMLGAEESESYALTLDFTPIDNFHAHVRSTYFTNKDGVAATVQIGLGQDNCRLGGAGGSTTALYYCGTLPNYKQAGGLNQIVTVTPQEAKFLANPLYLKSKFDADGYGLQRRANDTNIKLDYTFPGFAVLSSQTSYESDSSQGANNGMYSPANLAGTESTLNGPIPYVYANDGFSFNFDAHNLDQEFRLTSLPYDKLPLKWTVGVNYLEGGLGNEADLISQTFVAPGSTTNTAVNNESFFNFGFGTKKSKTTGIFGGVSYDVIPNLTVSFDGRYQLDHIIGVSWNPVNHNVPPLTADFKSFSPRAALDYKITPDVSGYVSYAKGSRPGGFNTSVIPYAPGGGNYANYPNALSQFIALVGPIGSTYQEESLTMYEVGLKGNYLDHHLRLNVDGYDGTANNLQVAVTAKPASLPNSLTATSNLGQVSLWGVEADASLYATRMLSFNATFAWNHTRIDQYACGNCALYGASSYVIGNSLPDAPEFSGTLGAELRDHLQQFQGWDWYADGDYVYRGRQSIGIFTGSNYVQPRNVLNLRAGVETNNVKLEVYVTNVTNDTNYTTVGLLFDQATGGNLYTDFQGALPPPRVFGGRVSYKF